MTTQNFTFGIDAIDRALNGGLAHGRLHEIYAGEAKAADQDRTADAASACGFAVIVRLTI